MKRSNTLTYLSADSVVQDCRIVPAAGEDSPDWPMALDEATWSTWLVCFLNLNKSSIAMIETKHLTNVTTVHVLHLTSLLTH